MKRNSIILYDKDFEGDIIPIGASKCGGFPYLPPEIEYPTMSARTEKFDGKTYRYEKSAMQFVVQINLYELAESGADIDNILPKKGMLYIFWSGEIMLPESNDDIEINFDELENSNICKVIYWDVDMSILKSTEPPCPYYSKCFDKDDRCFPETAVEFDEGEQEYEDNEESETADLNKIFGYPSGVNKPYIKDDEVMLFQFDCFDFMGCIWKVYWIIKESDLRNLDFTKVMIDADVD